ncbi:MAG: hypothetical protein M3115_03960 [Thermoproteota archaeon]|nr:hypothetical protein [Thermoproteota archaeon]
MATDNNQEDVPNLDFVIVSDPSHGEVSEIRQEEDESATSITNNENSDDDSSSNYNPTAKLQ